MWNEGNDQYLLVENGQWRDGGEYQFSANVYQDSNGEFWKMNASRSRGCAEYDYDNEIVNVEKKVKLVDYWATVLTADRQKG